MRIIGVDLAWGDRRPDGIAGIEIEGGHPSLFYTGRVLGDPALLRLINDLTGKGPALLAIDGPILCPVQDGMRPVDRLTHVLFGRQHAGCHPPNASVRPRPQRIARRLKRRGFSTAFSLDEPRQLRERDGKPLRRQIEVYPHPATLRLFHLDRIIKYKRGRVEERRRALAQLQQLIADLLPRLDPPVRVGRGGWNLFKEDPRDLRGEAHKALEDGLDAVICAIVGLLHWWHGGQKTQVLGDQKMGYLVIPHPV